MKNQNYSQSNKELKPSLIGYYILHMNQNKTSLKNFTIMQLNRNKAYSPRYYIATQLKLTCNTNISIYYECHFWAYCHFPRYSMNLKQLDVSEKKVDRELFEKREF